MTMDYNTLVVALAVGTSVVSALATSIEHQDRLDNNDMAPHAWWLAAAVPMVTQVAAQNPWQSSGPSDVGYWYEQWNSTLTAMQDTYWNGSYWPTTIQWEGAFLDNMLAACGSSFVQAESTGQTVSGDAGATPSWNGDLAQYMIYGNQQYYGSEDVNQIFGAAYDDMQWVVLEWLAAIQLINQYDSVASSTDGQSQLANYAHRAQVFYNRVQNQFDTSQCDGGLTWNPALATYKNAITNELFISSSISMYLFWPGNSNTDPYPSSSDDSGNYAPLPSMQVHDQTFLQNAIEEYQWFSTHNFTNAQGLIVDGFHISSGQTSCDERNEMVYTYNQGVLLSGLRYLWDATGDTSYLQDAYGYIETTINATGWNAQTAEQASQWSGLGRNGIMEDYCDAGATCDQDSYMFKGIYFHHLQLFCAPLPTSQALVPGVSHTASASLAQSHSAACQSYLPWVQHNAAAAINTENDNPTGLVDNWWGGGYQSNSAEAAAPEAASSRERLAAKKPAGSLDYINEPSLLNTPIFECLDKGKCGTVLKRNSHQRRSAGPVTTVETEGSGLSVMKTVSDLMMGT